MRQHAAVAAAAAAAPPRAPPTPPTTTRRALRTAGSAQLLLWRSRCPGQDVECLERLDMAVGRPGGCAIQAWPSASSRPGRRARLCRHVRLRLNVTDVSRAVGNITAAGVVTPARMEFHRRVELMVLRFNACLLEYRVAGQDGVPWPGERSVERRAVVDGLWLWLCVAVCV